MSLRRPNRSSTPSGAQFRLHKYINFKNEFAANGLVDLDGIGTYTDTDGDDWTESSTTPDVFEIRSTGLYMECSGGNQAIISILSRDLIPGLAKNDKLWAFWRTKDLSCPDASNIFRLRHNRNKSAGSEQAGFFSWRGVDRASIAGVGSGSGTAYLDSSGLLPNDKKVISLEAAGIYWTVRAESYSSNGAAVITPEVPTDLDILDILGTNGNVGGSLSAGNADDDDIDLAADDFEFILNANGGTTCSAIIEEFWLYRLE